MTDIELLPCPFCGGTSTLTDKDSPICPVGHILCDDCYASADSTRWNQRATAAKDAEIARWKEMAEWQGAMTKALLPYQNEAVAGRAEIEKLRAEVAAVWNAMPSGTRYLDLPDGGDVPLHEQVRRMAADAVRADRLAEALRGMMDEYEALHAEYDLGDCQATVDARAALRDHDQEGKDDR